MVDENELSKRFGYKNNSNLVIQTGQRNRENAPTGEAESLVGRIKYRMGDLANKGVKVKKPEKKVINRKTSNKIVNENETYNILEMDIGSKNRYRPTTIETKLAYDELLGILTDILGSQPGNIMDDIVFELLSILKNGEINEEEKRERCNNILSDIKNDDYTEIIDKSRKITDFIYNIDDELEESDVRNSSEVAVVFDESESEDSSNDDYKNELDDGLDVIDTESENENYLYEENDGDNDNNYDENNESEDFIHSIHSKSDKNNLIEDPDIIEINKLDAYWLQRELYSLYNDAEKSLELEQKIISILEIVDDQECENSLVLLFNYENFSWIKKLLKNRWNIYFCTILGQASSDNEKGKIIEKMKSHPQGSIVLDLLSKPSILKGKSSSFLNSIEKLIENSVDETNNNTAKDTSTIMEGSGYLYSKRTRGKLLDLERIYQEQSINTNLNTKVVLPEGTERVEDVDYDSIVIYPITAKRERINKVSISDLPEWCRECFSCVSITHLNEIQSKVYDTAFKEYNENMLICAPTGSGKTNIAMLCILNVISQYITKQGGEKPILDISKFKIVYVSPIKALVAEQVESLRMRLKPLGITVNEMTGDTRVSRSLMDLTQVFVTTPEKFDVITRKTTDGLSDRVKLIIFDEVHMLHDSRGAVLEGIVARFKKSYVRMVGLSATLPNYLDIAEFLSVDPVKGLFHFGPEYRPVPLLQTFIGIKAKKGFKKLQLMNELVLERVLNDITKHQILVFVHSRKDTLQTARFIRDKSIEKGRSELFFQGSSNVSREIIFDEISKIKSNNLKEILPSGIGIHHAGLVRSDRKIIEDLFSDGHIKVLVTTATLAWGVNLPAHTVIIKGTQIYQPERGEWTELSPLDMLQMIGRGGRPQYDNNGHGIVITDFDHLTYYLSLLNQQLNIESQLIPKLPDFINAEISLGNIKNKSDIINWIKDTFLYIRVRRNPKLYGLDIDRGGNLDLEKELQDHDMNQESRDILIKKSIENYLLKLIETSIDRLEKCEMIQYDGRDGVIESLFLGKISSHFYLTPETVCDLNKQLLPNLSEIQLFRLFSTCKEFKYLVVRNEEKIELEKLVNKVPIPIQGIRTAVNNMNGMENINSNMMIDLDVYTKINVLLQLYLTGSRWVNAKLTLLSDLHYIVQSAPRIFRAVFHLSLYKRWSTLAKRTLKIATVS
ncbi:U5snrp Brr2 SFII RNA helicase sec63 and the second part of the RNA [Cryptosporidium bovis]|uniref:U5snrp Brr2 SFII RNA helicase sec63 and the second part of the RNA n=1 Tax=Cryptosporidium bovis TaxID=310047 RepID=UPI00351A3380|nr:U5snrp Brr2 SFII RNA helicase sec63 and the second part of the RNA [Cryptosporidium bovis]